MAKKRSCRRTEDENKIHDKAVKIRKMTDEQIVHYIEDRVAKAYSEGYNDGKKPVDVDAMLVEIGGIKWIGAGKLALIGDILKQHLNQ